MRPVLLSLALFVAGCSPYTCECRGGQPSMFYGLGNMDALAKNCREFCTAGAKP